ncbi:MAG: glycoside hydrolase family 3 N-terminal domain-containing protein [Spirochaetaceae bacterium]
MNQLHQPWRNPDLSPEERADDLISRLSLPEKASQLLHESPGIERLGIPAYNWWNECLHGVARAGRSTVFPQAIALAATFDEEALERVATVISDEGRAKYYAARAAGNHGQYRGLTFWTPNVNIFRDPRWGRGQETYGEDPYLSSRLGISFVRGIQQEREGRLKAAACAKHYAVHSGPEALRHEFDARVSPRELRESYLPAFEALVREAKVEAVMGAYNRTNGEPCCASPTLLEGILRGEWGFSGHVVSDCWAIRDFHEHHGVTAGPRESVALAIRAGCDLNCGETFEFALEAVEEGALQEAEIDRALRRLLLTRFKLGLLDPPDSPDPWHDLDTEIVDSAEHRSLAREVAADSMVLLKNNGILPLSDDIQRLYVTGPNALNPEALLGNYYGLTASLVTPLEGIVKRMPEGVTVDYRKGALVDREKPNPVDWAVFEAANHDVTVAFLGLDSSLEGEEGDAIASVSKGDRSDIGLPPGQLDFLRRMKERGARVVVVLTGGSALAVPEVHELADALLMAWYPGAEGGSAIADVLFGDRPPAGHLPVTFYSALSDLPPYEEYSMEGRSYRYFRGEPLYPFGFGLSYTSFTFSALNAPARVSLGERRNDSGEAESAATQVTATVVNTGTRRGKVAVQLYLSPPEQRFPTPRASLRGVRKVTLEPGEARKVRFSLERSAWKLFDEAGEPVYPEGNWRLTLGAASPGRRAVELGAPEPLQGTIELTSSERSVT